jgi:Ca2+-transporting ATPase
VPLDDAGRAELLQVNETLAAAGLRVLGVAADEVADVAGTALTGLTFLGFLGLADPPAPGVKETIARLRQAGLRTIMLTGDQRLTAEAIGRELGLIERDQVVLDGRELEREPDAVKHVLSKAAAFSRVTPEHKIIVVRALQEAGEIVAMIGDGVNDAPALKQADIGVAMGVRGTDVAKQAAAIVLADDRFETIGAAVEEGRVIFENIRKFVFYLFSCNVAEIFVLLGAGLAGLPLPLLPLQLLWLNLVTDTFPALALAVEPAEGDVMQRPPRRPDEAVLSRAFVREMLFYSALITAATLSAFLWTLSHTPQRATTVAFMTLALAQVGHLGNARSASAVLHPLRVLANPFALLGAGVSVGLQLAAVLLPPLAHVLHLSPLDTRDWVVILASAAVPAVVGQAVKVVGARP